MTAAPDPTSDPSRRPPRLEKVALAGLLGASIVLASPGLAADQDAVVTRRLTMMGTELTVRIQAEDRATALAASEAAIRSLAATERRLSTWTDGSELARINEAPVGEPIPLSEETAEDLRLAGRFHAATAARFDPTIGALVRAWGLRTGGREPSAEEIEESLDRTGWDRIELRGETLFKRGPVILEEGGFGKGVGLDRALRAAREAGAGDVELDLGGQILTTAAAGIYGVAHPDDRDRIVLEIATSAGSLATSGNGERGIVAGGVPRGHLLDPATGRPAPDWGSLTVWAPTAGEADALSTGLYVLGPERALAFAAEDRGVEVLVLERTSGEIRGRASAGLVDRIRSLDGEPVRLSFVKPGASRRPEIQRDGELYAVGSHGPPSPTPPSTSADAEERSDEREYTDDP